MIDPYDIRLFLPCLSLTFESQKEVGPTSESFFAVQLEAVRSRDFHHVLQISDAKVRRPALQLGIKLLFHRTNIQSSAVK